MSSLSIVPPASEVTAGEYFTMQAVVPAEADGIRVFNEYGLRIGLRELTAYDNGDGSRTYTFKASIGTAGTGRALILSMLVDGEYQQTNASVTVDVAAQTPVIYSASIEEAAKVNEPVTVTVVTSKSTQRVKLTNEYGLSMGILSKSYVDTDEGRVWTLSIKIGTRGSRRFCSIPHIPLSLTVLSTNTWKPGDSSFSSAIFQRMSSAESVQPFFCLFRTMRKASNGSSTILSRTFLQQAPQARHLNVID